MVVIGPVVSGADLTSARSTGDYQSTTYTIYYRVFHPNGFGVVSSFKLTFYNDQPKIIKPIPSLEMHINQELNYKIPSDFYKEPDVAYDSVQLSHTISSSCDHSWITFSNK